MNKPFGFRGALGPKSAFDKVEDSLSFGNILILIKDGIFEVGYDKEDEKERALRISSSLIASWSKRNNIKIEIEFNQSWKMQPDGNRFIGINLHDEIKATDRIITTTATIKGMAYIIKPQYDSYSFSNDVENARNSEKDETLALALKYFHEEVVNNKKPMYGIHKAIEQIIKHLPGGRNKLAEIAECDRNYIDDLMTTVQTQRHSEEWLRLKKIGKIIDEQECVARTRNLIDAYSKSITDSDLKKLSD